MATIITMTNGERLRVKEGQVAVFTTLNKPGGHRFTAEDGKLVCIKAEHWSSIRADD